MARITTVGANMLHRHTGLIIDYALRGDTLLVERHGRPVMALVPIDEYEALVEARSRYEDYTRVLDPDSRFAEPVVGAVPA